jgi:hypothetical protein
MQNSMVTYLLLLFTCFIVCICRQKQVSGFVAGTIQKASLLLISLLFIIISADHGFSQSKKDREKLGMVKVKSERYKRKKSRETASFTSKGYNSNPPGSAVKDRQKTSSFIGNSLVPVSKPSGSNISNPGRADAYRNLKPPKPGRNLWVSR